MKVVIDVARRHGTLIRFDEYTNKDPSLLDPDIQHTIKILLDEPEVTGIQITLMK